MKPENAVPLRLVPVTLSDVQKMVGTQHRHNQAPKRYRFAVGVENSETGELVGVAAAAQPVARLLDDGKSVEVIRTCTNGTPNANSMLYGAVTRAAKALGFSTMWTYTLESESGSSLKAAGWQIDRAGLAPQTWERPNRIRHDRDMFGSLLPPPERRIRWKKVLPCTWLTPDALDREHWRWLRMKPQRGGWDQRRWIVLQEHWRRAL